MILTEQQTINLLSGERYYNCSLATQKFAYKVFEDNSSPLGNIICFQSPIQLGNLKFTRAIILCAEIPLYDYLAGICFFRLYLTQIGSILSEKLKKDCYVNENVLFVEEKQASISIINKVKESVLFHLIIPDVLSDEENSKLFFQTDMTYEDTVEFKEQSVNYFHYLTKSIFLEQSRDNI
jgi:hypothetical protein